MEDGLKRYILEEECEVRLESLESHNNIFKGSPMGRLFIPRLPNRVLYEGVGYERPEIA